MNCKERLINLLEGKEVDRPPFIPAIYDLKPVLVNSSLHSFGQNEDELFRALKHEAEVLKLESLTVAYDIYNIEAEAIGCHVPRKPGIGMPEISAPLIHSFSEIGKLKVPSKPSGRMPLFVNVTEKVQKKYGDYLPVRTGVSGPFSVAAKIFPQDMLLMSTVINPKKVVRLLKYCTNIVKLYIKSCLKTGAGIVVFDSFVSPPMLSPEIYRELVLPFHQELFGWLKEKNILQRTLISGGNTLSVLPDFACSNATQLLLDYNIPFGKCKDIMEQFPHIVFRVNIPPSLFIDHDISELKQYIQEMLRFLGDKRNLVVGTGVLPPNVLPQNIVAAKDMVIRFYK